MIKSLFIKNYAIIESLEMHFSKGLTIITGETGAGKSILLGALELIMGKRAETKVLYLPEEKCIVEGRFNIKPYPLKALFIEHDLDYDDDLVIRREITPSGKSRAFVNDTPVNLKVLQDLSGNLIDLHQQFDTLDLQDRTFQVKAIDALAGNQTLFAQYQEGFNALQALRKNLERLKDQQARGNQELDFLSFQLNELKEANLQSGEQALLEAEQLKLENAESIQTITNGAFLQLGEHEQSIISQIKDVSISLNQVRKFDAQVDALAQRLDSLLLELSDMVNDFERIAEEVEFDPERGVVVKDRLDLIYRLQSKHNCATIDELLKLQEELAGKLNGFENLTQAIVDLEQQIDAKHQQVISLAAQLTAGRQSIAESFENQVKLLLSTLAMPHAQLKVEIVPNDELDQFGKDDLSFKFAANLGSELASIRDVASGGEMSRLALVIKSLVANAIPLPTLVFDEIDTGISGDVALKMGNILRKVSNEHQVITITHSPQVAAKADSHYFVFKSIKGDRTITNVKILGVDERIKEIAIMLSQNPPTPNAIANATELVGAQVD